MHAPINLVFLDLKWYDILSLTSYIIRKHDVTNNVLSLCFYKMKLKEEGIKNEGALGHNIQNTNHLFKNRLRN